MGEGREVTIRVATFNAAMFSMAPAVSGEAAPAAATAAGAGANVGLPGSPRRLAQEHPQGAGGGEPSAVAEQGARVHQPPRQRDHPEADPDVARRRRRQHKEATVVTRPIVLGVAARDGQSPRHR